MKGDKLWWNSPPLASRNLWTELSPFSIVFRVGGARVKAQNAHSTRVGGMWSMIDMELPPRISSLFSLFGANLFFAVFGHCRQCVRLARATLTLNANIEWRIILPWTGLSQKWSDILLGVLSQIGSFAAQTNFHCFHFHRIHWICVEEIPHKHDNIARMATK